MNDYPVLNDFTNEEIDEISPSRILELRINQVEKTLQECDEGRREKQFYTLMNRGVLRFSDVANFIYRYSSRYPLTIKQVEDFLCFTTIPKMMGLKFVSELHDKLVEIKCMCSKDEPDVYKIKKELNKLIKNIPS